ncbi:ABC transporter permease [Trueperella pecoris]|uniref:ABC transporter permease n=1 Tax=Trueperella pecoris TaxID=2733571 RepID=UPI001ABE5A89|nr:FtsX-like permease family protein [Trueperella pecoris]QTG75459.1 ABC transporter permease [Trueperella pecoris]
MSKDLKILPATLFKRDTLRLGFQGLRAHPLRAGLSALGVAIGIGAMIAVIGISLSSQAKIQEKLAELGTNLLTVSAGDSFSGQPAHLPVNSPQSIARIDGVEHVGWTAELPSVHAYRNGLIERGATNGLSVAVANGDVLSTTSTQIRRGSWFNDATQKYPTTVLGATAAQRLGVVSPGGLIEVGGIAHTVIGILQPSALAPQLNTMVMVGRSNAIERLGFNGAPTLLFERSKDDAVARVRELIPGTVNPQSPHEVRVSRPSDTLAAQYAIDTAFTGLLVGVGAIALLVGGIGVANTMVITVIERRREIGLRRALGATKSHIRQQFLVEAILLSTYGGIAGVVLGMICTGAVSYFNGWTPTIPPIFGVLALVVTLSVGAVAGMMPAMRAAQVSPTAALQ